MLYGLCELHTVKRLHPLLLVAIGACDSYWLELHTVKREHCLLLVAVGACVSYSVSSQAKSNRKLRVCPIHILNSQRHMSQQEENKNSQYLLRRT